MTFLISAIVGIAVSVIAGELAGWAPRWAALIIMIAVRRLPPQYRERAQEEWTADLPTWRTGFVQVAVALSLLVLGVRSIRVQSQMDARPALPKLRSSQLKTEERVHLVDYLVVVAQETRVLVRRDDGWKPLITYIVAVAALTAGMATKTALRPNSHLALENLFVGGSALLFFTLGFLFFRAYARQLERNRAV